MCCAGRVMGDACLRARRRRRLEDVSPTLHHVREPHGLSILASVWIALLQWIAVFWFGSVVAQLIDVQLGIRTFAPPWLQWIGFILTLCGSLLILTSAYTLLVNGHGSPNPFLIPSTRLVTNGPYQVLRHPLYLGFVVAAFGYGLLLDSLAFTAIIAPIMFVLLSLRSAFEEQVLEKKHGARYHAYRQQAVGLGWRVRRRAP